MQRPDKDIIRRVLKTKGHRPYTKKIIDTALNLPLISLTNEPFVNSPIADWITKLENPRRGSPIPGPLVEPLFDEFVFHYKDIVLFDNSTHNELVESVLWGCFVEPDYTDVEPKVKTRVIEKGWSVKFLHLAVLYKDRPHIYMWQGLAVAGAEPEFEKNYPGASEKFISVVPTESCKEMWGNAITGMNQMAEALCETCQMVWHYAKYGDKHIVEVVPTKAKVQKKSALHKNRPWATASGPHILFLDRMPTTQKEGTGTHASPKPHRRRGHWKTLSHPRFRHHPQYQQKIYVKPSFVGPRQTTYEGNIYRLVQPLEDLAS
jgi:hypothetical protein